MILDYYTISFAPISKLRDNNVVEHDLLPVLYYFVHSLIK